MEGLPLEPTCGRAPRCLAATHWLALGADCCAEPVRAAGAAGGSVHDLVVVCAGRDKRRALDAVWRASLAFAGAFGLR